MADAVLIDCETTGLVFNHSLPLNKQPEIIEFYGCLANLETGIIANDFHTFIKPNTAISDKPVDKHKKRTITDITGIDNAMLVDKPNFAAVAPRIKDLIEQAPLVIAHNLSFDREIIDVEFERLGQTLSWPQCICTVEQTVHLKGYRLDLTTLHEVMTNEKFLGAHRANVDVAALLRCCVAMQRDGLL